MKPIEDASVLIAGVIRNGGKTVRRSLQTLADAFSDFGSVRYLVVESDSSDGTEAELRTISQMLPGLDVISLGTLSDTVPARLDRIAYCRNVYLDRFRNESKYDDVDFVAVADLDGINSRLTKEAVRSCFSREDWAVCTANQDGPYYDAYALRHDIWCPDDFWKKANFLHSIGLTKAESARASCYPITVKISPDTDWIEVDSAFGGLAVYQGQLLRSSAALYKGVTEEEVGECEHVSFHRSIRSEGGRIFINPRFINAKYTEHTRQLVGKEQIKYIYRSLKDIVAARMLGHVN